MESTRITQDEVAARNRRARFPAAHCGGVHGVGRRPRSPACGPLAPRGSFAAVLRPLHGPVRLVCELLYGSGLRLLEALTLRIKDLDFDRSEVRVRDGKARVDRVTMLPARVRSSLVQHLDSVRRQHTSDVLEGARFVVLPDGLSAKYPTAGQSWPWQWAFPATRGYVDRVTGERRRHHLHESVVQRAFHNAVLASSVPKPASCHSLRHSFATHLLEAGYDIRTIQES